MEDWERAPQSGNGQTEAQELVSTLVRLAREDTRLLVGLASTVCWHANAEVESLILGVVLRAVHEGRAEALLEHCLDWLRRECPPQQQQQAMDELLASVTSRLEGDDRRKLAEGLRLRGMDELAAALEGEKGMPA